MRDIKKLITHIKEAWGIKTTKSLIFAALIGVAFFLVEFSFIFVLQLFLVSSGLVDITKTSLPQNFTFSPLNAVLILIGFGIVRSVVVSLKSYISYYTHQSYLSHVRSRLLAYSLKNTNQITLDGAVNLFNEKVTQAGVAIIYLSTSIVVLVCAGLCFLFAFYLAPIELVAGTALLAIMVLPLKRFDKTINQISNLLITKYEQITSILVNGVKHNFFLKVYDLVDSEIGKGVSRLESYEENFKKYYWISSIRLAAPTLVGVITIAILTFLSLKFTSTSPAHFLSFIYIFLRLAQNAGEFYQAQSQYRLQKKYLTDIDEVLTKNEYVLLKTTIPTEEKDIHTLKIRSLNFSYSKYKIARDLNLDLKRGDILLIKGRSGSGKSTLTSLILGIIKPQSGEVLFNDLEISNHRKSFINKISYVGPEPYLIPDTIYNNLIYGLSLNSQSSAQHKMEAVIDSVKLSPIIEKLENKINYHLKEDAALSTGQKQRIAIARALLRNPDLLIFDEATSNLDIQSEKDIFSVLEKNKDSMITIIISHRNTFDGLANKQINMENP